MMVKKWLCQVINMMGNPLGAPSVFGIIGGMAGLLRRQRLGLSLAVLLVFVSAGSAMATQYMYGYVSMWDERDHMSDAPGSILRTCDASWTKCDANPGANCCGPQDGVSCCYRGVNRATVKLSQGASVVATTLLDDEGFFLIAFSGNPLVDYTLTIEYERFQAPNHMRLSSSVDSPPFQVNNLTHSQVLLEKKIKSTQTWVYEPNLRASVHTTSHSTPSAIAAIWNELTMAFDRFSLDGETRHRRKLGSGNSDDELLVRYTGAKFPYHSCFLEEMGFDPAESWGVYVARRAGEAYHGRVVGCDVYYRPLPPNSNYFAFPDVKRVAGSSNYLFTEGWAMAHAIAEQATFLSRWLPGTASRADILASRGIGCVATPGTNTNNAASVMNTALAMWDWLDADTAVTDNGYIDNIQVSMRDIMDGLYAHATTNGALGANRTNAEWWWNYLGTPSCNNNEACSSGAVCRRGQYGTSFPIGCYGGDMHGENLMDLAHHLQLLFPGPANFGGVMVSNPCIGTVDDFPLFNGGYRAD